MRVIAAAECGDTVTQKQVTKPEEKQKQLESLKRRKHKLTAEDCVPQYEHSGELPTGPNRSVK